LLDFNLILIVFFSEPMTGIEPVTSSLPRKRSTPELHRPKKRAGNETRTRDPNLGRVVLYQLSYSRLIIKTSVGRGGFEPPKSYDSRFTVCPSWPLWYLPNLILISIKRANGRIRTADRLITNQLLWPTELHWHTKRTNSS
jgi:hypothetical protein